MAKADVMKGLLKNWDASKAKHVKVPEKKVSKEEKEFMQMLREEKKEPPTIRLNSEQAPFVSDWEAGKSYTIVLKGKVDKVKQESEEGKTCTYVTLVVQEMEGV